MLSPKAKIVAAIALVALNLGAEAQCDQVPGKVTGQDSDCTNKNRESPPICSYQLKTSKGWFNVTKNVHDNCSVGEKYPQCGDRVNRGRWVPAVTPREWKPGEN